MLLSIFFRFNIKCIGFYIGCLCCYIKCFCFDIERLCFSIECLCVYIECLFYYWMFLLSIKCLGFDIEYFYSYIEWSSNVSVLNVFFLWINTFYVVKSAYLRVGCARFYIKWKLLVYDRSWNSVSFHLESLYEAGLVKQLLE